MARLNDTAVPAESIDALKRRFIRQNREIARANSTQSLRIRNLESETTRLLSENISLREQVIKLQQELDNSLHRSALDGIGNVKGKLEFKLAELSNLVVELGKAHKNAVQQPSPGSRRPERKSPKKSPDQRNWKNVLTLSEVTGGQDGRLPPIEEDKYFPRKTLDAEELLGVFDPNNLADSPDLGPPPVSRFNEEDPVKQDSKQESSPDGAGRDMPPEMLFPNLETRRKRRESSISRDRSQLNPPEPLNNLQKPKPFVPPIIAQPFKSGAKRKLSTRDEDERVSIPAATDEDGFRFNRRAEDLRELGRADADHQTSSAGDASTSKVVDQAFTAIGSALPYHRDKARDAAAIITATRRALGEKAVNNDPVVSPRKARLSAALADLKKDDSYKPRDKDRYQPDSRAATTKVVPPVSEPRPATADIINDPSPKPPIPASRDTPPPAPLDTGAIRPSRRPKANVSYTEPNLRDKMRRPGKELVDAVSADERIPRAGSVSIEEERAVSANPRGPSTGDVKVKKEAEDDENWESRWKNLPSTADHRRRSSSNWEPSDTKDEKEKDGSTLSTLPASIMTDRRRRTSTFPSTSSSSSTTTTDHQPASTSSTSTAIAALTAAAPQRKASTRTATEDAKAAQDVFVVTGLSPAEAQLVPPDAKASRAARRVSSVPHTLMSEGRAREQGEKGRGGRRRETVSVAEERGGNGHGRSGSGSGEVSGRVSREGRRERDREREKERSDSSLGRAERAAGRRRSMML